MSRTSPPPAAAVGQPAPPTEPRGAARSSRSPAAISVPPPSGAIVSDGSRFPFGCFRDIIRLWKDREGASSVAVLARKPTRVVAALPSLRPYRTLHRPIFTGSTTKVNHFRISPEARAQIHPDRYFCAEQWKLGTIARELAATPTPIAA